MTTDPAAPAAAPQTRAQIDRSLVHGVVWTGGIKWASQVAAWASTIVVARLLTPSDYGLVGMATLYLGLLSLLSEFGVGAAIVTLRDLTEDQIAQMNSVSVLFGLGGYLLSCAVAPLLGRFFHEPRLPLVVVTLSVTFVIVAFRAVPWALLQRDLRFKRLAVFDGAQSVLLAAFTILLAMAGFRYWTLVAASVLSAGMSTAVALVLHRHRFARPRWRELRPALGFSREIIVQRTAWYVYSESDFIVAGRVLGKAALGAYNLGWTLANLPIDKIGSTVLQVTPGVLSAVQHDRPALRRYVVAISEALAVVTFPVAFGLALVAPEFVPFVLGPKWGAMVVPLQLLSCYGSIRVLMPLMVQVLVVTGDARFASRNNLLAAVLLPSGFVLGSRWGLTGIALAWLLLYPLVGVPMALRAFSTVDLRVGEFIRRVVWPPLSSCGVMALAVLGARAAIPSSSGAARLILECAAGAIAYPAAMLLLHRDRVREARAALTAIRSGATPGA
jgi:PST family polysaccharide transporter